MSENNVNIPGEEHLTSLREYLTCVSAVIKVMEKFSKLKIEDFGPEKQTKCKSLVHAASTLQSLVGKVTDISEPAFKMLNTSQKEQLTELMDSLLESNTEVLRLVMVLKTATDFLENPDLVFAPVEGSGSV